MVYKKLKVVLGVVVNRSELEGILKKNGNSWADNEEFEEIINEDLENYYSNGFKWRAKIYSFPCCSTIKSEQFIICESVHTYYHKRSRCNDCKIYTVCEKCIGCTNNGFYDVEKILNEPTKVNISHICLNCFHDNRQDMNVPVNVGDHSVPNEGRECDVCGIKTVHNRDSRHMLAHNHKYERLSRYGQVDLYYIIDDCLYCT